MSKRPERLGLPPMHPVGVSGSMRWYGRGCRCDECRAMNAKLGRDRRRRIAEGRISEWETVPGDPSREAVLRMREAGMTWEGLGELIGTDRRNVQRLAGSSVVRVTRRMEARIAAAEERLREEPRLARTSWKILPEADRARWMTGCLMAQGWPSDWLGAQLGWVERFTVSTLITGMVHINTLARLEGVFKSYHDEWGPSRLSAKRAWRRGMFPSTCYDWDAEVPDYRPIPGSFHPDLVQEACTFSPMYASRRRVVLTAMHLDWGQWEREECAAAAMRHWQEQQDQPVSDSKICRLKRHEHWVMPTVWSDTPVA